MDFMTKNLIKHVKGTLPEAEEEHRDLDREPGDEVRELLLRDDSPLVDVIVGHCGDGPDVVGSRGAPYHRISD